MEVREPSAKYLGRSAYKQTEVGLIPEDWKALPLAQISQCFVGLTYSPRDVREFGTLVLRSSNVQEQRLAFEDNVYVDMEIPQRVITQEGDILICVRNGSRNLIGKCAVIDHATSGSAFGAFMAVLRSQSGAYLFQQFQSRVLKKQIGDRMGATINQITNKDMGEFLVAWPPEISERNTIAEALSDADALIEALEQLLAKKRQIKQGAMHELLTGQRRLPGFAGEWEMKRLGELASIQRGASPRPIDSPVWFDENSTVGWVRISDVTQAGIYLTETTQRLSAQGIQHSRPVASGSLIMSICATVGRPVITKIDTCIHDGFVVFDKLMADQKFLYYTLRFIEGDWSRHGQTGSQMNLNTGLINTTEVPVPPAVEEQTAIAAFLSDMDAELVALEAKLAKARAVKQGMMQELLTGRIRLV
jgi:type I restriction enzyme S subunit